MTIVGIGVNIVHIVLPITLQVDISLDSFFVEGVEL